MSSGSRGSISPLRSCALAAAENVTWLFASSWASVAFLARSVVRLAARYAAAPPGKSHLISILAFPEPKLAMMAGA